MRRVLVVMLAVLVLTACDPVDTATVENTTAPHKTAAPKSGAKLTAEQKNAKAAAESYLDASAFSFKSLTKQLEFEGFSKSDAQKAIKALKPDWRAEAVEAAEDYLNVSSFSRSGLLKQLEFEGFSKAQAQHGVDEAYR